MPLKHSVESPDVDEMVEQRAEALGEYVARQCTALLSATQRDLHFSSEQLVGAGVLLGRSLLERLYESSSFTMKGFIGGLLSTGTVERIGEKLYALLQAGEVADPERSST